MTTNRTKPDRDDGIDLDTEKIKLAACEIIRALPEDGAMKGFDSFQAILAVFSAASFLMLKLNGKLTDGEKDRLRDNDGWEIMGLKAFEAARNQMYELVEKTDPKQN